MLVNILGLNIQLFIYIFWVEIDFCLANERCHISIQNLRICNCLLQSFYSKAFFSIWKRNRTEIFTFFIFKNHCLFYIYSRLNYYIPIDNSNNDFENILYTILVFFFSFSYGF